MNSHIDIPLKFNLLLPIMLVVAMLFTGCTTQQKTASVPTKKQTQTPPETPQSSPETGTAKDEPAPASRQQRAQDQKSERSARAQLEAAREKLQVSQDTEKQVQAEFEKLKQSDQASPQVTQDYETYLDRIKSLVSENQGVVEKLEAAAGISAQAPVGDSTQSTRPGDTAELDRQLNRALAEFDEMLLKEMEKIQAQSATRMTSLAEEAAAAADRLRKKGIDLGAGEQAGNTASGQDEDGERSESEAGASAAQTETGESGDPRGSGAASDAGGNESRPAKTESGGETAGKTTSERSAGYGDDDDIVARQLREAAENETDPELREKLWKEYEDYKRNTRR